MSDTYAPINSQEELQNAISTLFDEEERWVRDYFQDGDAGLITRLGQNDQQRAFKDGMDALLRGLFRFPNNDLPPAQASGPTQPLNYASYANYISDGRLDIDEFDNMVSHYDLKNLDLKNRLGCDYEKFQQLAIGLINGLADKAPDNPYNVYSREELNALFSPGYIDHVYSPEFSSMGDLEFAIGLMNGICGSVAPADMSDALDIKPTETPSCKKSNEAQIG